MKNRRSIRNYLKIAKYPVTFWFYSQTLILYGYIVANFAMTVFARKLLGNGAETLDGGTISQLDDYLASIESFHLLGGVIIIVISLYLSVKMGQRVFGPTIPLERHINELVKGNYSVRTKLRKGDELQSLATALNQLSEKLEANKK